MANITRIENKDGSISFKITVYIGRDENGKQIRHYKTWKPDKPMSDKNLAKAVNKIAIDFERDLKQGFRIDNKQTFAEYAEYVCGLHIQRGDKQQTVDRLKRQLSVINAYIGNIKLIDLRPQHINMIYQDLGKEGKNQKKLLAIPKFDFTTLLGNRGYKGLSDRLLINHGVVKKLCTGQSVSIKTAEIVSQRLKRKNLFEYVGTENKLAPSTIRSYHGAIHTVLEQAKKEMIISYNPASLATLPKKKAVREPKSLTLKELEAIFKALGTEPIGIKTLIHILIVTGCRRGEVLAMKWHKLDYDSQEITIDESVNYSKSRGVFIGDTKTGNTRKIPLPADTMRLLEDYKREQIKKRYVAMYGLTGWTDTDLIFTNSVGKPMHPTSINTILTEFSKRHNLPHLHPHLFRHTLASTLISNGVDVLTVSAILGHSDIATTLNVYSHALDDNRKKVSECVEKTILQAIND